MGIRIERTHDKQIYLKEDRYDNPKENHKIIAKLIMESGVLQEDSTLCDFGCATGEFLYYLSKQFPKAKYYGYDIIPELIEKARRRVPSVEFQVGSTLDKNLLPAKSIDIATLIGVHAMYDTIEPWLSNLIYWTRKGGRIEIFGPFNPYPVDVWMMCRRVDDLDPSHREIGWNLFSLASVREYLDSTKVAKYSFTLFEMPFDLPPRLDDPLRSWTFLDRGNRRLFMNGASLILNYYCLEIQP